MDLIILVYVLLMIAFAKAVGELVTRVSQPAIVGELLAGIVLGPFLLGAVFSGLSDMYTTASEPGKFISDLGDLGMLFLMLYSGLQFSPGALRSSSRLGGSIAVVGMVLPMVLGYFAGVLLGMSGLPLAFLSLAVSVTALPVTLRMLVDLEVMRTETAGTITSAALITDAALMLGLSLILGSTTGPMTPLEATVLSGGFIMFFVLAVAVGRYVVPHVYQLLKWMRTGEAAFAVAIGFAIAFAILAERLGLPTVIGAFIAGLLLRQAGKGLKAWDRVEDILSGVTMGFLAPIFFVLIGFTVDFKIVMNALPMLAVVTLVAIVGKIAGSYVPGRAFGLKDREAMAVGSMMMAKGAMELVFARIALEQGIIDDKLFSVLVLMAFVSTMLAPIMFKFFFNRAVGRGEIKRSAEPAVDLGDADLA